MGKAEVSSCFSKEKLGIWELTWHHLVDVLAFWLRLLGIQGGILGIVHGIGAVPVPGELLLFLLLILLILVAGNGQGAQVCQETGKTGWKSGNSPDSGGVGSRSKSSA